MATTTVYRYEFTKDNVLQRVSYDFVPTKARPEKPTMYLRCVGGRRVIEGVEGAEAPLPPLPGGLFRRSHIMDEYKATPEEARLDLRLRLERDIELTERELAKYRRRREVLHPSGADGTSVEGTLRAIADALHGRWDFEACEHVAELLRRAGIAVNDGPITDEETL